MMRSLFLSFALATALLGALGGFMTSASAKPSWVDPSACILDDGYNRYRPCGGGEGS